MGQSLPAHERRVLETMFTGYSRLVVKKSLTGGLAGSKVYLVRPVRADGPELPAVVKIDLFERIEQEWNAYSSCIRYKLPGVAEIRGEPINPTGSQYSGLWYPLAGAGIDEISSLHQYLLHASPEEVGPFLERRLFRRFAALWQQAVVQPDLNFRAAYDDFLPLNLIVECTEIKEPPGWLHPQTIDEREWAVGSAVQISGFKVVKLLRDKQGLSLDTPERHKAFRFHVYGVGDVSAYQIGQIIDRPFTGVIKDTRQRQLMQQAQKAVGPEMDLETDTLTLSDGRTLPNPLLKWPVIFSQFTDAKVACIHGDLNMENVLVEMDTETVYLIDFAKSGRDHVLRDLLHLEMAVVNKILSTTMAEGQTADILIHDLYRRLHCVVQGENAASTTGQEKVFTILQAIRQAARPLLFQMDNWREYYNGLFIYLLGSLRFGDLDKLPAAPRPKQLAFWGAATILDLMDNQPSCSEFAASKTVSLQEAPTPTHQPEKAVEEAVSDWDIDKIVADWQVNALSQRLILFNILKGQFSMNELSGLAYSVGLDLEDLPSSGKSGKAQELLGYFERRGRIRQLLEAAAKARPDIHWG
jgi:hypothetical protein